MAAWLSVWNDTRGEWIPLDVRRCASFLCRLRGLTFRRRLRRGEGLLLIGGRESRVEAAIHMLFVFFPIATVWLDGDGRVVDARLARPFRPLYIPRAPARDVLEGPPELLERVAMGERLRFLKAPSGSVTRVSGRKPPYSAKVGGHRPPQSVESSHSQPKSGVTDSLRA
ncbi:MAG TPA: hypothetical protein EYH30_06780 [Anaerolineales bacterium]|nr:hypothetical protein [Anaerolineales bacterium]